MAALRWLARTPAYSSTLPSPSLARLALTAPAPADTLRPLRGARGPKLTIIVTEG